MNDPARPRILVLDDEPQIHRFLGPALEAAGYAPLRAGSAAERTPALVLLDLGLPDGGGKSVIPKLRGFTEVPIVILSARDQEWDLLAALLRGGEGRVMTHRQLLTTVWGPAHAEEAQYLRVHIGHLRQKLGPAAGPIRTEPGVGYRFGGE